MLNMLNILIILQTIITNGNKDQLRLKVSLTMDQFIKHLVNPFMNKKNSKITNLNTNQSINQNLNQSLNTLSTNHHSNQSIDHRIDIPVMIVDLNQVLN